MSGRTKAAVRGNMLRWARQTSGYQIDEVAARMGLAFSPERILAMEADAEKPSIAQAKNLAKIYGRSLSLLYLPEPPAEPDPPADFRMGYDGLDQEISPALRKLVRRMQELRESALDLADDLDETNDRFPIVPLQGSLDQDPALLVGPVRHWLGIDADVQSQWRDPKLAFDHWRAALESRGVIVYVELGAHSVSTEEVRGFCLAEDQAPLIVVNNLDAKAAQVFTLFHELGHILLRLPAMCLDMDQEEAGQDQMSRVEVWCNRFAGEFLVPRATVSEHPLAALMAERLVESPSAAHEEWDDDLRELAAFFAVSAEVIVRRLTVLGWLTAKHYRAWKNAWYERHPNKPKAKTKGKGGPSPAQLAPTKYGMGILSLVYSAYWSDAVSALEVGSLIGGKTKTVKQLEGTVRRRLAEAVSL